VRQAVILRAAFSDQDGVSCPWIGGRAVR